jgi:ATP-dependent protease HslVU (ClpYQ) peptidase subunit
MTTIVYRDGILASDTQISYGSTLMPGSVRKIHKLSNGALYGFTGSLEVGEIMRRRVTKASDEDGPLEEEVDLKGEVFEAIIVQPDGQILCFENRIWMEIKCPYIAMGSGKDYAYGALHMGASAKQALKTAMTLDPATGGRIITLPAPLWGGQRSYCTQEWEEADGASNA